MHPTFVSVPSLTTEKFVNGGFLWWQPCKQCYCNLKQRTMPMSCNCIYIPDTGMYGRTPWAWTPTNWTKMRQMNGLGYKLMPKLTFCLTVLGFHCNKYLSEGNWSALWRKLLCWGWCGSPAIWYRWWRLLRCPGSWTCWYWCRTGNPQCRIIPSIGIYGRHILHKAHYTWCLLLPLTLIQVLPKVHNREWVCSL